MQYLVTGTLSVDLRVRAKHSSYRRVDTPRFRGKHAPPELSPVSHVRPGY